MKILLVMPKETLSTEPDYNYMFPLGIGYISSVLKQAGHDVACLNLYHKSGKIEDIMEQELLIKYDFVCTGGTILHYSVIEKILSVAKTKGVKTILGGMIINGEPETVFKMLKPDYAVLWEGEKTIVELLEYLKRDRPLDFVKGIMFWKAGFVITTAKRDDISNLDSLPYPDYDGFDYQTKLDNSCSSSGFSYFDNPRLYHILGSRSCIWNCSFCFHYSKYRKRSIKSVIKELKWAVDKYRINTVEILDECLSLDKEKLFKLCKEIKKLNLVWIPQVTVRDVDDSILRAFKESRAIIVSYGFESFSPAVLKSMHKPITPEMISTAFEKTLKAGLGIQANFIFGDIAETKETSKQTLDWWKSNAQGQINLAFIQPYPGSEIYKVSMARGILGDKETFIKNIIKHPLYNMTNEMSNKDLQNLRRTLVNLERKYRKISHFKNLKRIDSTYSFDVRCPYCKQNSHYENFSFKDIKASPWNYQTKITCRNCLMGFNAISRFRGIIYKYFPLIILMKVKDALRGFHIVPS